MPTYPQVIHSPPAQFINELRFFVTMVEQLYYSCQAAGKPWRPISWLRSYEEQAYLSKTRPVAASPGSSAHNFGLAIDLQFEDGDRSREAYIWLRNRAKIFGLDTGLEFDDPNHVFLPGWKKWISYTGSSSPSYSSDWYPAP